MNLYRDFKAEDFLSDEFFMEWVLTPGPEHQLFWDDWLANNPDRVHEINRARNIISSLKIKPNNKRLNDEDVAALVDRFLQETTPQPSRIFKLSARWIAAAAMLVVGVTAAVLLFRPTQKPSEPETSIITVGTEWARVSNADPNSKMLKLSDGSIIVLKPHSEVSYPLKFSGNERQVILKGEGFFEVAKDPAKPFLVHAGNMVTKVLGTSFTISAYHGDVDFKVVVNTGKVQVYDRRKTTDGSGAEAVILTPNLTAVHAKEFGPFKISMLKEPLLLSPELAKKAFSFYDTPLPAIIAKLEQAYGATINYDKAKYADVTVTASLSKLPLDEKVRAICKAIDAQCEFKDGNIMIK